jgi:hypothetical protein
MSEFELMKGKSVKERAEHIQYMMKNKILRSNLDLERGHLDDSGGNVRRIPTFFTQTYNSLDFKTFRKELAAPLIEKGMTELEAFEEVKEKAKDKAIAKLGQEVTTDLGHSLQMFHGMALNFGLKHENMYFFNAAETVLSHKDRQLVDRESNGIPKRDKRGKLIYKKGNESTLAKQVATYMEMQVYGIKDKDLGVVAGTNVDVSKGLRGINSYTGIISQAVNLLASTGNFLTGEYNNFLDGIANEFYSTKDLRKATKMYANNAPGIVADIGARTPSNIVNLLDVHYGLVQGEHKFNLRTTERSKVKRLLGTSALFFLQGSSEHYMQTRAGLAMMNKIKMYDKNGAEKGSLLDNHKKVGNKLKIPTELFIKDKHGKLVQYTEAQQNNIANKVSAVIRKLHGNYDTTTANGMKQDARTSLLLKFRDWMTDGMIRRFGTSKANHMIGGEDREGFYVSAFKAGKVLLKDMKKMKLDLTRENWAKLTPHEKANIKRTVTEVAVMMAVLAASSLIGAAGKMVDDEFDSDSFVDRAARGAYEFLLYESNRLFTEISFYTNPVEFVRLFKTPAASTSVLENTIRLGGQLFSDPFEKYEAGWREGDYKMEARIEKLVPIYKQITTLNAEGIKDRGAWLTY